MFNRLLSIFLLVASLLALVQCEQLDGFPYRREVTVMPEAFRSMNHLTRRDTCAGVTCPSGYRKVSYKAATEKVCNCIPSQTCKSGCADFAENCAPPYKPKCNEQTGKCACH
ncbi:uncharacterized protein SEPMUDRAFT_119328 [Sphaerulina musiva SO2202]|uniref:Uncharacterized protein n=1 Tax=Sphaerulina musiva (strain SO2202) TaxID=692275 RepID=N1QG71_SPHMS|nr:uncharacterized protein SEPMUDRAFT_119328 [Sphaerulina musiva SO2202]EMF10807.1 hypothetical protein SEPMUDRAFT_119328 [Sphaerulina musiva SO2202]